MKKKVFVVLMCSLIATSFVGCGKEGNYSASDIEQRIKDNGGSVDATVGGEVEEKESYETPDFLSGETVDITWGDLNQKEGKVESYGVVAAIPKNSRVLRSIGYPVGSTHVSETITESVLSEQNAVRLNKENAVWKDIAVRWVVDESKNTQADLGIDMSYVDWNDVKKDIDSNAVEFKSDRFDEVWYYYSDRGFLDIDIKPKDGKYSIHMDLSVFKENGENIMYENVEDIVGTVLSRVSFK